MNCIFINPIKIMFPKNTSIYENGKLGNGEMVENEKNGNIPHISMICNLLCTNHSPFEFLLAKSDCG